MVTLSVCVCVYGCFVSVVFVKNPQFVFIRLFLNKYWICDVAYCDSVPHSMVCVLVHFPCRVRFIATDDTRIMVSLSVCLCAWVVCMPVIFI